MALRASVKLLRDKPLVPAQEGVRRSNRGNFFQALASERVGQRCKPPAVGIGEAQPAVAELACEDAVFLLEIGDDLLLVALQPADEHGDQDVEDHGVPQVKGCAVCASSILST